MSSFFGVNSDYSSSMFSSLFGNTSTNSGSNALGDLSMIQSGTYKKLLKSYYKETGDKENSTSSAEDSSAADSAKAVDSKKALLTAKDDAEKLYKAANDLFGMDFSVSDSKQVNIEELTKNVKAYIESYNNLIDSGSEVDNKGMLQKTLSITQTTKANKKLLEEIGITIGSDNKLKLDEETLKEAKESTLSTIFNGRGSVISGIGQKASQLYNLGHAATYNMNNASSYTYNGNYKPLSSSSMYNSLL